MPIEEIRFVSAGELKTIEDYAAALLSGMISLKTLASFHLHAESKGLLETDEVETAKTIIWEIRRLINIYKTQVDSVLERTEVTHEQIMKSLASMIPQIKKKRGKVAKE